MSANNEHPLAELISYCAGWAHISRTKHRFTELLGVEVAQDIVGDVVRHERGIAASAHKAEVNCDEALRGIAAAQAPDSEGGEAITPNEAKRLLVPYVVKARDVAHDTCDAATV